MLDDTIAAPGLAHRAMAPELDLINDLMGGTAAMRRAGQRWLPREPAESWTAWRARLNRTVLFNGLARTVQTLAARPFARPVMLENAAPALAALAPDIDRQSNDIGGFAALLLQSLLRDGLTHILIDRPQQGGPPYFVHIRAADLLAIDRDDDGIAAIRIRETHCRKQGRFGQQAVPTIRYIDRTGWQLWQTRPGGGWQISQSGTHDFGAVPLVTLNAAPTGFMQARPPLIDLAWLNLAHWQSASDQRHILHVARVPILFGRALQVADGQIEIGPNRLILADDPAADLRFVEHSGAAIAAGRQDLLDLEDQMAVMGLDMMRFGAGTSPGTVTATERAIAAAHNHAALGTLVQTLESGMARALQLMADWMGISAPGTLAFTRRHPARDDQAAEADLLLRARLAGEISSDAFLAEIARRGILGAAPSNAGPSDKAPSNAGPSDTPSDTRMNTPHKTDLKG